MLILNFKIHMIDKVNFWDNKIINWEKKRYSSNSPIKNRSYNALEIIKEQLKKEPSNEIIILEIGCGSGIFAEQLTKADPRIKYYGFDLSSIAIEEAKSKKIQNSTFFNLSVEKLEDFLSKKEINPTFVISLGLFDWLNDIERNLIRDIKSKYFLHSFSVKNEFLSFMHSIYVFLLYGFKDTKYVPRYDTVHYIKEFFGNKTKIYRNKNMNIAAIATNINYE